MSTLFNTQWNTGKKLDERISIMEATSIVILVYDPDKFGEKISVFAVYCSEMKL